MAQRSIIKAVLAVAVVVATLAAFGGLGWWLLQDAAPPAPAPARPDEAAAVDPHAAPAKSTRSIAPTTRAVAVIPFSPGSARRMAKPGTVRDPYRSVEVTVVDERGMPMPSTLVTWLPDERDPADAVTQSRRTTADWEDLFTRVGEAFPTDGAGVTIVPEPETSAQIFVSTDGHAGWRRIEAGGPPAVQLTAGALRSLRVKAVDAEGVPISGMPVGAFASAADLPPRFTSCSQVTDDDGLADFGLTGRLFPSGAGTRSIVVGPLTPFAPPIDVPLDEPGNWPDPIRLVVPAAGRLRISVVDARGAPITAPARIVLSVANSQHAAPPPVGRDGQRLPLLTDARGYLEIAPVGVGISFVATASYRDVERGSAEFTGPSANADTVAVRITVQERGFVLTGRLVDGRRRPFARTMLSGTLLVREPRPGSVRLLPPRTVALATDEDGRFRLRAEADGHTTGLTLSLSRPATPTLSELKVDLTRSMDLAPGTVDFGDVTVTETPTGASGVVVDEDGAPVVGATVTVADPSVQLNPQSVALFNPDRVRQATTRAGGWFAVASRLEGQLTMTAIAPGFEPSGTTTIAAGATDLRIILAKRR